MSVKSSSNLLRSFLLVSSLGLSALSLSAFPGWTQVNADFCSQYPQDIRCSLSSPAETNSTVSQPSARPRIAVLNFDFSRLSSPYISSIPGVSQGVSDVLINKLVTNGAYAVVERTQIEAVLNEQDFGSSGQVDTNTAAQIGRILGVEAVVIGTVTQFDLSVRESGGGAPVVAPFGRIPIAIGAATKDVDANVQLNARLVNTSTAEILAVAEGQGNVSQSDSAVTVGGFGGGSATSNEEKLLFLATDQAIEQVADQLVQEADRLATLPQALPTVDALVADVFGNTVIVNKGSDDGYQEGMNLSIERVVREVTDPETGEVIRKLTEPVGRIKLTEVDSNSSVGTIVSGGSFSIGDVAKPTN